MRHLAVAALSAALCFAAPGCGSPDDLSDEDNPLNPNSPNYEAPIVEILDGPAEGAVVAEHAVSLTWSGNLRVDEFRYTLDGGDPSDWAPNRSVTLRLLDEGEHTLEVEGRREEAVVAPAVARTFTVDAVRGPALMLKPRRVLAGAGDTFQVEVIAEEVSDVMLVRAVIRFDEALIDVVGIAKGDFLSETDGRPVFLEGAESPGMIDLNIAVAEGEPQGLEGTGTIATLSLKLKAGQETEVEFLSSSKFRRPDGADVDIRQRVPAVIEVR
jgi:hypothetical protein